MKISNFMGCIVITASAACAAAPYAGVSGGYLIDNEEEYIAAHVGFNVGQTGETAHALELEVGYTSDRLIQTKMTITPITLNYRATAPLSPKVNLYSLIGVGGSYVEIDFQTSGVRGTISDDDFTFTAQAAVGAEFSITTKVAITLAARYIWISDADLFGTDFDVGDDVAIEAGLRIRF